MCFLGALQAEEGLGEVEAALEGGGVLQAVDVDCGAGVMFDVGPLG